MHLPFYTTAENFQLYIVDAYVKTEGSRLNYLRHNKNDLRVELYEGLLDALQTEATNNGSKMGKLIILLSSFQGSLRYMRQNYQDAMTIVRKYRRKDLFVTFTCNTTWPEILNSLESRQRPKNQPDIVVRIFKIKLT
ncbi:hypothetical protein AVEN_118653-1 [Araneus ventricosus]|uniref:Helitron helicase-like domain-containing protein n=1 Tax=Araneus ventricosus TaxID=182803 RepID=A0A4Y2AX11_ARAVE|nr:hypothetical protein AVEN_118653-1 [Araneus ventricosus]